MFDAVARAGVGIAIDGVHAHGEPLCIAPREQIARALLSSCIMCGSCSEACPQVNERTTFAGAFLFCGALAANLHPLGRFDAAARLGNISGKGGLADCSGALNCEAVCPMGIPLGWAAARLNWLATGHVLRQALWG